MKGIAGLEGELSEQPLPELLGELARQRLTGVARLSLSSGPAEIYLFAGQVAAVELPGGIDRLAEVLQAAGVIDAETVRRSLATPRPPGLRYGRLLVESGLLPPAQLLSALRLQIKRRLHRLFFAEGGGFAVEPGEHDRGLEAGEQVAVDVRRSVLVGVRSAWSEARFGVRLPSGPGERLELLADASDLAAYALSPAEEALLVPLARGPRSLEDLVAAAAVRPVVAAEGPAAVRAVLYALLATGALAREGSAAATSNTGAPPAAAPPAEPHPHRALTARADSPRGAAKGLESSGSRGPSSSSSMADERAASRRPAVEAASASGPGSQTAPRSPAHAPAVETAPSPSGSPVPPPRTPPHPNQPAMSVVQPGPAAPSPQAPARAASAPSPFQLTREETAAAIAKKRALVDREDLFQVLGVPRDADRATIKTAYLDAARAFHPDRLGAAGLVHLRTDAEHIFRRVSEAQATLINEKRRAAYLEKLGRSPAAQEEHVQAQRIIEADVALREGDVALRRRDFATALARLADSLRLNPLEGEALALHAWARFLSGQAALPDLRKDLEHAVVRAPNVPRCHYYLGMARKQGNDLPGAVASFRRAVELDPHLNEAASELRLLQSRLARKR